MGATADAPAGQAVATKLGFKSGQVVQEFGYDDDVDLDLREAIEEVTGAGLLDEETDEVVDTVVLWWREGDGDLIDALVDALTSLVEGGNVWLLTPKPGRAGYVEASDIEDAAPTAGLHAMSSVSAGPEWSGTRLASRNRR